MGSSVSIKNSLRNINTHTSLNSIGKNRNHYITTQTPQVFDFNKIFNSYQKFFTSKNQRVFDDASVYDYMNDQNSVHLVDGREYNIKITTELDYFIAERIHTFFKKTT